MIVGFDHDDITIFDEQFEFLQETCIPIPSINLLTAPDGTRLWARLYKEGRIISTDSESSGRPRHAGHRFETNVIPKRMSRLELFTGYARLVEKACDWDNFASRMKGFVSGIKRKPDIPNAVITLTESDLDRALMFLKMAQRSGMIDSLIASQDGEGRSGFGLFRDFFLIEDEKARNTIFDIIRYTIRNAPFMLEKVLRLIVFQYAESLQLQPLLEGIHEQIELEKSGAFKPLAIRADFLVLENFKKPYREIFPEIYERVYLGLEDKTRTGEALIEIFTDFIIRWGRTFEKFEEHHKTFLFEIADRTIAKENNAKKENLSSEKQHQKEVPDIKKTGLADEVLKYVEQELRNVRTLTLLN
jgi:hypothetical protein